MVDERIPGVVFQLDRSEVKTISGKQIVEVILIAHVKDFFLEGWKAIEDKLDGLKIYEAEDFQTQVNNLLREDNDTLEHRLANTLQSEAAVRARLSQVESFAQKREEELQEENNMLRGRVAQLEALERELLDLSRA